jgi:hypothetical protein
LYWLCNLYSFYFHKIYILDASVETFS